MSEFGSQVEISKKYKPSGLKSTLHGTAYQLKLLMLFFQRGFKEEGFKLYTEVETAEKFDDIMFQYNNGRNCRFLQAKHSQIIGKEIIASDLLTEKGPFSLKKYFKSYRRIKINRGFEGIEKDFVLYTNIDIAKSLEKCFEVVNDESKMLKHNNQKSRLLKFKYKNFSKRVLLQEKLKNSSDLRDIATELALWASKNEKLNLRQDHIFYHYISMLGKIIEVPNKKRNPPNKKQNLPNKKQNLSNKKPKKKFYAKFRKNFFKEDQKEVLSIRKAFCETVIRMSKDTLNETEVLNQMRKKKLQISEGFAQKLIESSTSKVKKIALPDDNICDEDVEDFFKNLIFAVGQPNEVELDKIIENEISEGKEIVNMISSKFIASEFQRYMLDWMKMKTNKGLTQQDGEDFFKDAISKLSELLLTGKCLKFQTIIKNFHIASNKKLPELESFLHSSRKQIFNLVNPHKPALSSIKVVSTLNGTEQYKKAGSYILISLKSVLIMKDHVINAFTTSPLLVIECKGNEENIDDLITKLSTKLDESKNKKIILITQKDNCLASKFKEKFNPEKYEEKYDNSNKLTDLTKESQELLLSKGKVQFQGKEVSLKLLIDEAKELIDGKTLFQLIKGEKIEVGIKRPGLYDLESFYCTTSINIKEEKLSRTLIDNNNDLFVFIGITKYELSQKIPDQDLKAGERIYLFKKNKQLISGNKYVILTEDEDEDEEKCIENFKQVCGDYSLLKTDLEQFAAHLIRKRDDNTLTWIRSYNSSLYINRNFLPQVVINIDFLREIINKSYEADEKEEKRDIFVISNIYKEDFESYYNIKVSDDFLTDEKSMEKNHIHILEGKNEEDSFRIFCDQRDLKAHYNIHWLENKKKSNKNYLIWRRSKGAIDKINELKETKSSFYFNENDLRTEKAVVLAGDAGIGKSTTLTHFLGQPNESEWVIKLDLVKFDKQLSTSNNTKDIDGFIESFFSKINIGVEEKFAKLLFKHKVVSQGKITFLFDGFDEITAKSQETIIKLLKLLKNTEAKFRITTRGHDKGKLEKCLSKPSYIITPFTHKDLESFFNKFREIGLKFYDKLNDEVSKSAETFLQKIKDKYREDMFTPLMTRMFADVYREAIVKSHNCNNPEEFEDIKNFSISYIYERFMRRNYDIYLKEKVKVDNIPHYMKNYLIYVFDKKHEHLAFRKLFPQHAEILIDKSNELSDDDKKCFKSIGIVKADSSRTDLYFTHQTFAEYFAARFLIRIIKKNKDHPKYKKIYKFWFTEIFKNKNKLIQEFIDKMTLKENLVIKWEEIKDSNLVKITEEKQKILLSDEASDSRLSDLQEVLNEISHDTTSINNEEIPKAIERFVHRFLQETDIEQLKTNLSSFLNWTDNSSKNLTSLNEVYLIDKISIAIMHYFKQSEQSNLHVEEQFKTAHVQEQFETAHVEEQFKRAYIARVGGKLLSNFDEVLKNFEESGTNNNLQQLSDFFIPSNEKKGVELAEWIKLNSVYYFVEKFRPDVIKYIKSYNTSKKLIQGRYVERILNSLVNTKFPLKYVANTFGVPWNLSSLQSLVFHIIDHPTSITQIKFSINDIFKKKDKVWLGNCGIFISGFLQILTNEMSESFISAFFKNLTTHTITYSRYLLQFLICPIVDKLRKEKLPHINKSALMKLLGETLSYSVENDGSILLTNEQLQSMLQFVENLLNEKHQNDSVLSMISKYIVTLGKGGLNILEMEKKLIVFDCLYKFHYDFSSSHAKLIIRKIRNSSKSSENEKSCIKAKPTAPEKRKLPKPNSTKDKKQRLDIVEDLAIPHFSGSSNQPTRQLITPQTSSV